MSLFAHQLSELLPGSQQPVGVVVVDHGSRKTESNELLWDVVAMFRAHTGLAIVEPAHMELAEPSISTAFDRCVEIDGSAHMELAEPSISTQRSKAVEIDGSAHMELAEPSISTAFDRCVEQGAATVVVFPYFLSPGRHWSEDIPRLAAEAAEAHPQVRHLVTAPLGLHPLIGDVMVQRIATCLAHHVDDGPACDLCGDDRSRCQLR